MIPTKPNSPSGLYTVWLYDGFDNEWMEVLEAKSVSWEIALNVWNECTKTGTCKTKYEDIDYFTIEKG